MMRTFSLKLSGTVAREFNWRWNNTILKSLAQQADFYLGQNTFFKTNWVIKEIIIPHSCNGELTFSIKVETNQRNLCPN